MKNSRGFTLIEVVIVIVLVAVLASAAIPVILAGVESLHYDTHRNALIESSRLTLDRIGMEIWGLSAVSAAESDKLQFTSFRLEGCADRSAPTAREIAFDHENATEISLWTSIVCGGVTIQDSNMLSEYVNEFSFTYLDIDGKVLAVPKTGADTDIASVRIKARYRDPKLVGRFEAPLVIGTEYRLRNGAQAESFLP